MKLPVLETMTLSVHIIIQCSLKSLRLLPELIDLQSSVNCKFFKWPEMSISDGEIHSLPKIVAQGQETVLGVCSAKW